MNSFVDSSIGRIVLQLVENLGSRDTVWHVGAMTSAGDMQQAFQELGCRVITFGENGGAGPTRSIRRYVRQQEIGVVHTHTPRTILHASLALRGLPDVKHVATKHLLYTPGDRRWGFAHTLLDRLTLYPPDVVIPVSSTMRDRITSQPLIDRTKVVVVRNGIAVERFSGTSDSAVGREVLGLPEDAVVLGYAGRIDRVKRIDLLLAALRDVLARHHQVRLVVAGEGPLKGEMEALAGTLGISHAVAWPGFVRDMPGLLAAIDVYVQPSVNEGLSLSILEAMAAGSAVVATDVGGTREVVVDGETGMLVPPGSSTAIASAVLHLLDDPAEREAIARAARARVETEFRLQTMADGYRGVYATVTGGRSELES